MPIRPEYRHFYKGEWKQISLKRKVAANFRCEWCGAEHGAVVKRDDGTTWQIILTVAHLNHNPADNSDDNLRCLCQPCHLSYDAKHHAESRRLNARRKLVEAGQQEMPL